MRDIDSRPWEKNTVSHSGVLTSRPGDAGVRADFEFETERVVVTCDTDIFEWTWEEMRIAPWDAITVRLNLPDGELFYRADDPLRFADAVEEASDPTVGKTNRRWLDSLFSSAPRREPTDDQRDCPAISPRKEPQSGSAAEPTLTERAAAIDLADPFSVPASIEPEERTDKRPAKRLGSFRRPKDHTHRWAADTVNGGLVRRVCEECHHVSIDLRMPNQKSAR